MNTFEGSKEQLLQRIEELELLNRELLSEKEKETRLEFAWTGNLGHWYWNIKTNAVTFDPLKISTLGYDKSEISEPVTYQFFTDKIHPEDYLPTMDAMRSHLAGKATVYEAEYRIQTKSGAYRWYYDRGRITQFDTDGKPVFLAGIVFDVTVKKEMQLELEQKNRVLARMSSTDGLTQISNHSTLLDLLTEQMAESTRTGRPLTAALLDVDDFKRVNDSKGHVYGDKVLAEIAAILKAAMRETDIVGRYGGEEFMAVFVNTDLQTSAMVVERIVRDVEAHNFADGLKITVSAGVGQYAGEGLSDFVHGVDVKLYKAKKLGKNRVVF
jgi:diguanylate cyclase (GGDEF)-like protein/PAS domain S-box-containing protein